MKERSRDEIVADLTEAGVARRSAERLAQARGLEGQQAKKCIEEKGLDAIEITPEQQRKLFLITYKEIEGDVIRICTKADVVAKYGALSWPMLQPAIRDLLVDLRYRGDYTPVTREKVQPPAVKNDLPGFSRVLADRDYWVVGRRVPVDRFDRRCRYLCSAPEI